jgi:hypothetical protein
MSTLKKRTRLAAVATATLTGASIFALAAPASAAVAPLPVDPSTAAASGGNKQITVSWKHNLGGDKATAYVVYVHNYSDSAVAGDYAPFDYFGPLAKIAVAADNPATVEVDPPTSVTITDLPAGKYKVYIVAHNAYGDSAPTLPASPSLGVDNGAITVTDPSSTAGDQAPIPNYTAYRPYANWDDLLNNEYKLWTGHNKKGSAITNGRGPRLDELTFWRYNIAVKPLTAQENANWATYYTQRLNWLVTDPNGDPATAPHAPADKNKDGVIDAAELDAAEIIADDWGLNDVYFDRREVWAANMAEEAAQTDAPAYRLYTAYFSRTPDYNGLAFWSTKLRTGWSLLQVSEFFLDSDEFIETYGEYETFAPEGPKTDAAEFVALVYKNVLNRDPDGAGFAFWTRQLQTERYTPAEVLIGFSEAHEFKQLMHDRTTAGSVYAHLLGRMPTPEEFVLDTIYDHYFVDSPGDFLYLGPNWVSGYERLISLAEFAARK